MKIRLPGVLRIFFTHPFFLAALSAALLRLAYPTFDLWPFAWVAFFPATWFLGSAEFSRLALLTPLVGLVVFGGAVLIWQRGVRQYASTGS